MSKYVGIVLRILVFLLGVGVVSGLKAAAAEVPAEACRELKGLLEELKRFSFNTEGPMS